MFFMKAVAPSIAAICMVIAGLGFFAWHPGVGWGFAIVGVVAFLLTWVARIDRSGKLLLQSLSYKPNLVRNSS